MGNIPWNKGTGKKKRTVAEISEERRQRMLGDKNPAKRLSVRKKIRKSVLKMYKENPKILENRKPCGKNQYFGTYTSIEKPILDILKIFRIPFIHNFRIGSYFVDFLIFEDVIIECDGEYWHRDSIKEQKRESFLHLSGYNTFHFWGKRILRDPTECVLTLINVMADLGHKGAAGFQCDTLPFGLNR